MDPMKESPAIWGRLALKISPGLLPIQAHHTYMPMVKFLDWGARGKDRNTKSGKQLSAGGLGVSWVALRVLCG